MSVTMNNCGLPGKSVQTCDISYSVNVSYDNNLLTICKCYKLFYTIVKVLTMS